VSGRVADDWMLGLTVVTFCLATTCLAFRVLPQCQARYRGDIGATNQAGW
jgi:hypothetical protein